MPQQRTIPCICQQCDQPFLATAWAAANGTARFCSKRCAGLATSAKRWGNPEHFWSNVERSDGCWLWTGSRFRHSGYGRLNWRGQPMLAHRLSYEMHYGPIPDDLLVCHSCDNPPCVRPDHLFLGTHKDNTQDMIAKGRFAGGFAKTNPPHIYRGEASGAAKLTEEQVREIRRLRASGTHQKVLAEQFCVSVATIYRIAHRIYWRHIE